MYQRGVLVIALLLILVGAGLTVGAALKSQRLTGEWLGYPLPSYVAAAGAIGLMSLVLGVAFLAGYAITSIADRPAIRRILATEIVSDVHVVARFGRVVLWVQQLLGITMGILLLAWVVSVALQDPLSAVILGATTLLIATIYILAK